MIVLFQAEDGRRDLVRYRGLGDVYKRQAQMVAANDTNGRQRPGSARDDTCEQNGRPRGIALSLIHI